MSLQDFFDSCGDYCKPDGNGGYNWSVKGLGFGQFYFYIKDDKIMCSNELMGKEFIKKMLCQLVDECVLDCPSNKEK